MLYSAVLCLKRSSEFQSAIKIKETQADIVSVYETPLFYMHLDLNQIILNLNKN